MIRQNPSGMSPQISQGAFVDETALIIGHVIVHENVFIGPYAVIRADELDESGNMEPIIIGYGSNVQDGVVIHSKAGAAVTIGTYCSIAHRAIVHGPCRLDDYVFLGFNSVVFDCHIHGGCFIRHSVVIDGCDLPPLSSVPSGVRITHPEHLQTIKKRSEQEEGFSKSVIEANLWLGDGYRKINS